MVDIDNFKQYNDTYGHLMGDGALKAVSEALGSVFTRSADAVCRYGGEEFLVCSSLKQAKDAQMLAEKALQAVRNKKIAFGKIYLSISIGYTFYRPDSDSCYINGYMLTKEADQALYAAKLSGKDKCVLFSPDLKQGCEKP